MTATNLQYTGSETEMHNVIFDIRTRLKHGLPLETLISKSLIIVDPISRPDRFRECSMEREMMGAMS
jgi:hypothetical protein